MPVNLFPYTNLHEMNLDWVIAQIKTINQTKTETAGYAQEAKLYRDAAQVQAGNALASANTATQAMNNALDSATAALQSAGNAAASASQAQQYAEHIADPVAGLVADWLQDHVDPATGYVIDNTLTIAGAAADAKATGDSIIDNLSAAFTGIREYTNRNNDFVLGYSIPSGGIGTTIDIANIIASDNSTQHFAYALIDVSPGDRVIFTGSNVAGGSARAVAILDENNVVVQASAAGSARNISYDFTAAVAGKCLINCLIWTNVVGDLKYHLAVIKNDNFVKMESDIAAVTANTKGFTTENGYSALPADLFVLGDWGSWTGIFNRQYRVRSKSTITFTRDTYLIAGLGYYLETFTENSYSGLKTCIKMPADVSFKVNIRKITEDTSSTADLNTYVSAMEVSSPVAGIEKFQHTFTDVTMFPRVGISGDSYSAGGGIISGVTALTWGKNMERESGVIVDIYARSGESIVGWNSDTTNGLPALLAGPECGLYWFQHGINGTSTDAAIGTPEDMEADPKPDTFYGQYVYAIQAVQQTFPNARIVLATIAGTSYGNYQTIYAKVNSAIHNIAEYCSVPVIDIIQDDLYRSRWYADSMRSNHPTAMLNAGIAHANRRLLAKCIMDNPEYFVNYGSI